MIDDGPVDQTFISSKFRGSNPSAADRFRSGRPCAVVHRSALFALRNQKRDKTAYGGTVNISSRTTQGNLGSELMNGQSDAQWLRKQMNMEINRVHITEQLNSTQWNWELKRLHNIFHLI